MKLRIFIIIVVIVAATAQAHTKVLDYFTAISDGKAITLEWRSSEESTISRFEIERCSESNPNFVLIETINADGSGKARKYIDEEAYMRKDSEKSDISQKTNFTYRIKVIYKDSSSAYSDTVNVTHTINSIRRTWGMIKQMFR